MAALAANSGTQPSTRRFILFEGTHALTGKAALEFFSSANWRQSGGIVSTIVVCFIIVITLAMATIAARIGPSVQRIEKRSAKLPYKVRRDIDATDWVGFQPGEVVLRFSDEIPTTQETEARMTAAVLRKQKNGGSGKPLSPAEQLMTMRRGAAVPRVRAVVKAVEPMPAVAQDDGAMLLVDDERISHDPLLLPTRAVEVSPSVSVVSEDAALLVEDERVEHDPTL